MRSPGDFDLVLGDENLINGAEGLFKKVENQLSKSSKNSSTEASRLLVDQPLNR